MRQRLPADTPHRTSAGTLASFLSWCSPQRLSQRIGPDGVISIRFLKLSVIASLSVCVQRKASGLSNQAGFYQTLNWLRIADTRRVENYRMPESGAASATVERRGSAPSPLSRITSYSSYLGGSGLASGSLEDLFVDLVVERAERRTLQKLERLFKVLK